MSVDYQEKFTQYPLAQQIFGGGNDWWLSRIPSNTTNKCFFSSGIKRFDGRILLFLSANNFQITSAINNFIIEIFYWLKFNDSPLHLWVWKFPVKFGGSNFSEKFWESRLGPGGLRTFSGRVVVFISLWEKFFMVEQWIEYMLCIDWDITDVLVCYFGGICCNFQTSRFTLFCPAIFFFFFCLFMFSKANIFFRTLKPYR